MKHAGFYDSEIPAAFYDSKIPAARDHSVYDSALIRGFSG